MAAWSGAAIPSGSAQGTGSASLSTRQKASLSGKVQTKDGTALAGARVELIPVGQLSDPKAAHISAITAADGTFRAEVPWAGDYIWGVSLGIVLCQGRVQPPYAQPGRTLSFARGEQKSGVVMEVEGGGVLQGMLQDQKGKGAAKGDVTLTQRVSVGEKAYRWFALGSVQADDTGRYGFCNVPKGSYFVNAQGTMRTSGGQAAAGALPKDYVQTFYPNVLEEEASQPVRITAGGIKRLDLVLRDAPTHHVRGRVVFPPGRTLRHPLVVLHHVNPGNSTYIGYHAEISAAGSFDLAGIPPGKYTLVALAGSGERELRKIPIEAEIEKKWSATAQIEVNGSDVAAGDLMLAAQGKVSGQLWDARGEKLGGGNLVLTVVTAEGGPLSRTLEDGREIPWDGAEIEPDGHFILHELPPGKYRIGWLGRLWIKRPPPDEAAIYLAGATIAGRDALRDGFEVRAGEEISNASIVAARGAGAIKAKVRDHSGKPRPGALVLLVPAEEMKREWHRYQSACSYPTGDVYLGGIPPGDYRLFAMEAPPVAHYIPPWSCFALEKPRWEDLKIYEQDSTAIHIVAGNPSELDLRLIPAR